MTWNILADIWLDPKDYKDVPPKFLDSKFRLKQIKKMIASIKPDVLLLQEVQENVRTELHHWCNKAYSVLPLQANATYLWRHDLAPNKRLIPTGNVIIIRRKIFQRVSSASLLLSKDGDMAALVRFVYKNHVFIIANVHLDPRKETHDNEMKTLVKFMDKFMPFTVIIAGDFNSKPPHEALLNHGFTNTVKQPASTYYCESNTFIDHIYLRTNISSIQGVGHVHDALLQVGATRKKCRELMLSIYGSDHLPVILDIS
jgi:endonuclease/exonuclease/phosphatase family metal-dependent hydrolase